MKFRGGARSAGSPDSKGAVAETAWPRTLYLQNGWVLEALYYSRPRDLHRIRLQTPGVEFRDVRDSSPPPAGAFDLVLIGHLSHPLARPVPEGSPFDEALLRAGKKRVLMIHDVQSSAFRGGHERLRRFIQRWVHYVIVSYPSRQAERCLEGCEGVRKVFYLGNHINMDVFRDYGLARDIDVLLYGQLNERDYPFRRRLAELLPKLPLRTRHIRHPYEGGDASAPRDEALSRLINRSWLAIATPSRYKYLLPKYLEIAASRTVVAGKLPRKERKQWRRCYVRLDERMDDEEIARRLRSALANKRRLLSMADQMYASVRPRFGYPQYRDIFRKILLEIHRDEFETDVQDASGVRMNEGV